MSALQRPEPPPPVGQDRLSRRHFDRLSKYINTYSGIQMPPSKLTMLEGRLRRRTRATGHRTLDDYCNYLFEEGGLDEESIHLIDAVTTNKTDFFREPQHFDFLQEVALPGFLQKQKRSLKVWSSASSIGAEPYTLAMILEDFHEKTGVEYGILATDLSTDVLAATLKGIYDADMVEPVPAHLASKYIMRSRDPRDRRVRMQAKLRARLACGRLNLMSDNYGVGNDLDIVFCRNVLIYFDKPTQSRVLHKLCATLAPGGYLCVGHSETVSGFNLPLRQISGTILIRDK